MVRAKFTCTKIESNGATNPSDKGATIILYPVVGGSAENESFYRWTPGGSISLSTVNESAAAQFEEGKAYYVDFTPAE